MDTRTLGPQQVRVAQYHDIELLPEDFEGHDNLADAAEAKLQKLHRERKAVATTTIFAHEHLPDYSGKFGPHPWRYDQTMERAS